MIDVTTHEEILTKHIGPKGSKARERHDREITICLIGHKLKTKREELGITQEELGKKIGMDKTRISKIERGIGNISLDTLLRVTRELKIKKVELWA